MSYSIHCCDETPEKEATKGERLYFGSQFKKGYSLSWGGERGVWKQECEAPGCISHTGWQQRMLDAGAQLAFSFY